MSVWNRLLFVALVLQVGLVWWMHRTEDGVGPGGALLKDLKSPSVNSLRIEDGKDSLFLKRTGEESWILPNAGGVAADARGSVNSLLERLEAVELARPLARQPSSHGRLNVADNDFSRRLTLGVDGGEVVLILGRSGNGYGAMHLRRAGENEVYRLDDFSEWDFQPRNSSWVETTVFDKRQKDLRAFTLETVKGVFFFTKETRKKENAGDDEKEEEEETEGAEEDVWLMAGDAPAGKEFDATNFGIWLNQQGSWLLADVIGLEAREEHGFAEPTARMTFLVETKESIPAEEAEADASGKKPVKEIVKQETKVLSIGAKRSGSGDWYATITDDDRIFTVADHRMKALLERDRESFFKAPKKEDK